jgi:hypothetical protein
MLNHYVANSKALRSELAEFKLILSKGAGLAEHGDLLPLFRSRIHLAASLGFANINLHSPDRLAVETNLFGSFRCDVVVGDSGADQFTLIELEDAKKNSIFELGTSRAFPRWASRLEKGMSQLVDWCWRLDHERPPSATLPPIFGCENPKIHCVLVIGRDLWLDGTAKSRLEWRRKHNGLFGHPFTIWTYDQFVRGAEARLAAAELAAWSL